MKSYKSNEAILQDVWVKAWCAVANTENCTNYSSATVWANECHNAFKKNFIKGEL